MANNIFINGGVDNNWSNPANWSLGLVPTATDGNTVVFNSSQVTCNVDIVNAECNGLSINFTVNLSNNNINVSGSLYCAGTTFGSTTITFVGVCSWSSNGSVLVNNVIFSSTSNVTVLGVIAFGGVITDLSGGNVNTDLSTIVVPFNYTGASFNTPLVKWNNIIINVNGAISLQNDLYLSGDLILAASFNLNSNINNYNIYVSGSLYCYGVSCGGTTTIHLTGNGVVNVGNVVLSANINFNTNGTYFIYSLKYTTGIFKITKGNIKTIPGAILAVTGSCTFSNISNLVFINIIITGSITVNSDSWFSGNAAYFTQITSTTSVNYNVNITKPVVYSKYLKIKNCTAINKNSLVVINENGNLGSNNNILFGNSTPNGFPSNNFIRLDDMCNFNDKNESTNGFPL